MRHDLIEHQLFTVFLKGVQPEVFISMGLYPYPLFQQGIIGQLIRINIYSWWHLTVIFSSKYYNKMSQWSLSEGGILCML